MIGPLGVWPSGKARALGARDRGFESHRPDHFPLCQGVANGFAPRLPILLSVSQPDDSRRRHLPIGQPSELPLST